MRCGLCARVISRAQGARPFRALLDRPSHPPCSGVGGHLRDAACSALCLSVGGGPEPGPEGATLRVGRCVVAVRGSPGHGVRAEGPLAWP